MKNLNYYQSRNLSTENEVFDYLIDTLKNSIFTWSYYVDFEKVNSNVNLFKKEYTLLNYLIGNKPSDIDDNFIKLLETNPNIRKSLPLLIALRRSSMKDRPIITNYNNLIATTKENLFNPKMPLDMNMKKELITFFQKSGLKDLFVNGNITNILDYCFGIEVGMDTNARKNRTGDNMEAIVEEHLGDFCENYNFEYMSQATKSKIQREWDINIEVDEIKRRFDFALLSPNKELTLIETNYYSGGGSKLKATAGEYKDLQRLLSGQGFTFIWITDGLGWTTAKTALYETFLINDYTFNLEMVTNGILKEVLLG